MRKPIFEYPMYLNYNIPHGWLANEKPCHALFYYALLAIKAQHQWEANVIVYEGNLTPDPNFKQLFTSVATMYGVSPESMLKFWTNVDMQLVQMGSQGVPKKARYRFDSIPELRSH